jgi:Leucine-rich repeat (LRR) protein
VWTIVSGLNETGKVYFEDASKPDTRFHGMPGETYTLQWSVSGYSTSTVKIVFAPLQATITNNSPANQTQFFLTATTYDSGQWTIDGGNYAYIRNQTFGGTVIPDLNAPNVKFQGYAHRSYKLTWTTKYGSKTASTSITLNSGDYLETEGLTELQLSTGSNVVTYENGHVTGLNLGGNGITWVLTDTVGCPAIQAFTYLKKLTLSGGALFSFPTVIGDRYQQLEYLNVSHTGFTSIPNNIGNLKKLKEFDAEYLSVGGGVYSLPATFGQLQSLQVLRMEASGIQSLPDSFGQLQNLVYCDVANNSLQYVPSSIGNCSNLVHLAMVTQNGIPGTISKLSKLTFLYLASGSISLPSDIGNMSSLDTLQLQGSITTLPTSFANLPISTLQITGSQNLSSLPSNFGSLPNLQFLTIAGSFTSLPASFSQLSKLQSCTLYSTNLSSLPTDIGNLKNLQYLSCTNSKISALPASIGDLSVLIELRLGQNKISVLPTNFFSLTKIKTIDLGNNQLTSLPADFQNFKNTLSLLYLQGNNYPAADLIKIKQLLPTTSVYPY